MFVMMAAEALCAKAPPLAEHILLVLHKAWWAAAAASRGGPRRRGALAGGLTARALKCQGAPPPAVRGPLAGNGPGERGLRKNISPGEEPGRK